MVEKQFHRTAQLIGTDAVERLRDSFVVVVGLGAVGGFATEALARSGVGRLRLVDHDSIRQSNLNRQIFALHETLGRKKIEVAKDRVHAINPNCSVDILDTFVHFDTIESVLHGNPDVVVDAIDSLNPKIELISALIQRNQTGISSMGAALRLDPGRIQIGSLVDITHCPLASFLRKRLRRKGIEPVISCVFSNEEARLLHKHAVCPPDETETVFQDHGRHRMSLGSLATITGIFGLTLAHWVIMKLAGYEN